VATRFNGATPRKAWKSSDVRALLAVNTGLQWGHASEGVEKAVGM